MNEQDHTIDVKPVKPCVKCGSTDRYACGKCRPCQIERAKSNYRKNPSRHIERSRLQRVNNQEYVKAYRKEWYAKNKELVKARSSDWAKKNPEKRREQNLIWIKRNKEKHKDMRSEIRANRRNAKGKLSKNIVQQLMDRQRGLCVYCECALDKYHLDHIMPIALGGANTDDNVQLLCPTCNLRKGSKHPDDFLRQIGKMK